VRVRALPWRLPRKAIAQFKAAVPVICITMCPIQAPNLLTRKFRELYSSTWRDGLCPPAHEAAGVAEIHPLHLYLAWCPAPSFAQIYQELVEGCRPQAPKQRGSVQPDPLPPRAAESPTHSGCQPYRDQTTRRTRLVVPFLLPSLLLPMLALSCPGGLSWCRWPQPHLTKIPHTGTANNVALPTTCTVLLGSSLPRLTVEGWSLPRLTVEALNVEL
jgi:hypothetical protein